ncbi:MAG: M48 family metallopeptidase [Geobacteraceae bacterium]|nr:M48 family metallopeptidase [Geobacteraceae bacterium]
MKTPMIAAYYDGTVSTRHTVQISLVNGSIIINGNDINLSYPTAAVIIPPAVGSIRRTMRLPDGGLCEFEESPAVAILDKACSSAGGENLIHRWERSLFLALCALAVTVLVVALFLRFGVPAMAKHIAMALPPDTESRIGSEALKTLDQFIMKPTKLDQSRRDELSDLFRRVAGKEPAAAAYRLEFRAVPAAGANAFALPAGIVVITDDLVALAKNDDEIAAVLAHELGHVRNRHIIRHILQSSATGLIVATLTGDVTSITSLAATLPTVLMDTSFSREFEREADDAALAWMKTANIPPRRYGEILARLQAQLDSRRGTSTGNDNSVRNYLSTHPETGERIRRILKAGGE